MITAKELFRREDLPVEEDKKRLAELNARMAEEPRLSRIAVGNELLEIIRNREEPLEHRAVAPFILAALVERLELANSNSAAEVLMSAIDSEFFSIADFQFLKKKRIKRLSAPNSAFLLGLIVALIAVDREKGARVLRMCCKQMHEPEFKTELIQLAKQKGLAI
jgi:hypothetical protein